METLLTLPFRLLAVVLVGWCAWSAIHPLNQKLQVSLANPVTDVGAVEPQTATAVDYTRALAPIAFALATAITFYVAFEVIRFQRFQLAVSQIKKLGGSISAMPMSGMLFQQYVFSSFKVDLSDTNVNDACCPSFRSIPSLITVRLDNTNIGKKTLEELSHCTQLKSLDISHTPIDRKQIGCLAKLKNLKSLLLE